MVLLCLEWVLVVVGLGLAVGVLLLVGVVVLIVVSGALPGE